MSKKSDEQKAAMELLKFIRNEKAEGRRVFTVGTDGGDPKEIVVDPVDEPPSLAEEMESWAGDTPPVTAEDFQVMIDDFMLARLEPPPAALVGWVREVYLDERRAWGKRQNPDSGIAEHLISIYGKEVFSVN